MELSEKRGSILPKGLTPKKMYYQLSAEQLHRLTLEKRMGVETSTGAIAVRTGKFTGRSPKDRFIVQDPKTSDMVWWGKMNQPFTTENFAVLFRDLVEYLNRQDAIYVRDGYACALEEFSMGIKVVNEYPWSNLFVYNMLIRPKEEELNNFEAEWTVLNAPGFKADPEIHGTRQENFTVINFSEKMILIGGTGYTGEIKKSIFYILNFSLPLQNQVFPMHCSANYGKRGDTSLFFGLSGTGKTTLSTDQDRSLIGDDEHGWSSDNIIFNFEGGCYAKTLGLSEEREPEIYNAIRFGALLENVVIDRAGEVDYEDDLITQNSRVSYPIEYIANIKSPSIGDHPRHIFFLTADAFGVLPPLALLDDRQAAYHFISGYTSKIAGTEVGINDPVPSFSACFGAPFLPLHPITYAKMLQKRIQQGNIRVWLVNTGWTGGSFGKGYRIPLQYTRTLIRAVLGDKIDPNRTSDFTKDPVFKVSFLSRFEGIPHEILNPGFGWKDQQSYLNTSKRLAIAFMENFEQYHDQVDKDISTGGPFMIQ